MNTDTYKEPEIIVTPRAIIKVYRPILTDEEHKKRMKAIHDAAANLLKSLPQKVFDEQAVKHCG